LSGCGDYPQKTIVKSGYNGGEWEVRSLLISPMETLDRNIYNRANKSFIFGWFEWCVVCGAYLADMGVSDLVI